MTKLWTMREIEKDFLDVKPNADFMCCINACRTNAKEHLKKLDEEEKRLKDKDKWNTKQIGVEDYRSLKLIRVRIEKRWIKYFFNLE